MKNYTAVLISLFSLLLLVGCVGTYPRDGFNTQPEGPVIGQVEALGEGGGRVTVLATGRFGIQFPATSDKPAAIFSFAATDINDRLGLALDVRNTSGQSVCVYTDLNKDTWVRGFVTVPPGKTKTLYVFARRLALSPSAVAEFPAMHGIPGGKMSLWAGIEEPVIAKELKVFVVKPRQDLRVEVSNLRPFGSSKVPDLAGLFPFVDRYGQYKHADWPGKVHADSDLIAKLQSENADLAAHPGPKDFDQYGGWSAGPQLKATGSFRVEKYQGRWWLVDPAGRLFWSHGLDVVGFDLSATKVSGRERFYEDPPASGNFLERNLQTKFGAAWSEVSREYLLKRLHSWGLNTLGGASDPLIIAKRKIPYTVILWTSRRGQLPIDPDSPAWVAHMRSVLTEAAVTMKDDPWCLGFFVDNEIHTSTDPAWFERYYRQVSATAKELMPDKLYLGSRLDYHDWPDEPENRKEIVRIAARYCDVISFNFYKFTVDDVVLPQGVDKPAIIGEFHMGALDRGLFHTGLRSVLDQRQRAEAYRNYVSSALRNPTIVGAHWFQCYDESVTGRADGENYQIGFLDICDSTYSETIAAARDMGYQLYTLRVGK